MPKESEKLDPKIAAVTLLALGLVALGYFYLDLKKDSRAVQDDLSARLLDTTGKLEEADAKNDRLESELRSEQSKVETLISEVREISSTVGVLDKLSKTDPELLQKYSKVYFLNEHYTPLSLKEIDEEYLLRPNDPEQIHAQVWPKLEDLLQDAEDDDIDLKILSAFRSFNEQSSLKATYSVIYGSGANAFSADQGYSEHQLGTTVDFTTSNVGPGLTGFENTEAYDWLQNNAYKYGFTLSYPPNNAFYVFEPWHWRYVGEDLARDLRNDDKYFYDLDQRTIDGYLVNVFD